MVSAEGRRSQLEESDPGGARRPSAAPPVHPGRWQELLGHFFLTRFSPPIRRPRIPEPPTDLVPWERFTVPRRGRQGKLVATWYPAPGEARGAVLLVHPWLQWGQAYFHRRGRLPALRRAGYHAMTFNMGGFGDSSPPRGLPYRDVGDALAALRSRAPGLPLHLWGISFGGTWAQVLLSREDGLGGAFFEHPPPHLVEFSYRVLPGWWPAYKSFRLLAPRAYRYCDARRHAPFLGVRRAAFVGGELDEEVRPEEVRELAHLARSPCLVVPDAPHLAAIKVDPEAVIGLALATFREGEEAG